MTLVVFGYPDGRLANATFRAYKRARRSVRSRGLAARVELRPLGDLPPVVDLLIVMTPADPGHAPSGVEVRTTIVAPPERAAAEVDRVLDEMVARGELAHAPAPRRTIAVHRGVEPVTERARVADPA